MQFRGNFRVFYSERHRGDLNVRPAFWNSNAYEMNTIDQPASSSTQEISARKSTETELWALTMRTSPSWSESGTLYCDNYDDSETVGLDDGRRRPLRDGIIE